MPDHRLAEVFGYPISNQSPEAQRHRSEYLCPFHSYDPLQKCTKFLVRRKDGTNDGTYDERKNSNGVCSIAESGRISITCPVRFREDWVVQQDVAAFFFPGHGEWRTVPEVTLRNASGDVVGNIDFVMAAVDATGQVRDFGALEVQGVYISGNVGNTFRTYLGDPADTQLAAGPFHADYLSSVKRLLQQLIRKGVILSAWGKKQAIAVDEGFVESLQQPIIEVPLSEANMAWYIYHLGDDDRTGRYALRLSRVVYTTHEHFLQQFAVAEAGPLDSFVADLSSKIRMHQQTGKAISVHGAAEQDDELTDR